MQVKNVNKIWTTEPAYNDDNDNIGLSDLITLWGKAFAPM